MNRGLIVLFLPDCCSSCDEKWLRNEQDHNLDHQHIITPRSELPVLEEFTSKGQNCSAAHFQIAVSIILMNLV